MNIKTLIDDKLEKIKPISEKLNLDQAFDELNKILSDTTSKIAPRKQKGKKKKKLPVMNDEILHAVKRKKTAFYIWKQQGRPKEPGNFYLKEKTITTYDLRTLCRKEQALERINTRQQILDAKSSDTTLFYKLIRKQRGKMGDIKNAKNYRGITITPTYSKIIEIIIKGRENNKILEHQNPLQKGFTAKSTPLLCELFIEEFERENKDLKLPTYVALLDGKSAFDVVVHKNLIRRLFQIGFSQQSILLISNLYENATSCVKWGNTMSNRLFNIEQGVRQGGAISADLYKVYINPLLQILSNSGLGAKIGNINCCAPTCADDIALISNNPFELQNMINLAVDFSQREGYLLQPQKSVVLPIKTCNKMLDVEQGFWKLKNIDMPIVQDSSHIGIKKSQKDSTNATITENIKKARRSMYSLMGAGLHGENGLDPETVVSLFRTYILPVLTYGLEVLIPTGKNLDLIQQQHKRWIKQILSLKLNVADPAVYMLSGLLPLEAEIHIKIITLFGNITRSERSSLEWRIAERQLQIKTYSSNSWFIDLKKICGKYDIIEIEQYLDKPLTKIEWKRFITKKIHKYWESDIKTKMKGYSTLKYLNCEYDIGRIHPLLKTTSANITEIKKLSICTKFVTEPTYYNLIKRSIQTMQQIRCVDSVIKLTKPLNILSYCVKQLHK
ncbi:Hypothetical predicted protein [Mytilus galloprovincialis]|uniref:Reverse transcriptase domain-containing protein n=1 Tax=Mytilus galloprovincialis TaxID=29158 RepID=A0A8B6D6B2_MYTGA|nr:Hypothetical predicted protein [Mytilus galloprovincialis]